MRRDKKLIRRKIRKYATFFAAVAVMNVVLFTAVWQAGASERQENSEEIVMEHTTTVPLMLAQADTKEVQESEPTSVGELETKNEMEDLSEDIGAIADNDDTAEETSAAELPADTEETESAVVETSGAVSETETGTATNAVSTDSSLYPLVCNEKGIAVAVTIPDGYDIKETSEQRLSFGKSETNSTTLVWLSVSSYHGGDDGMETLYRDYAFSLYTESEDYQVTNLSDDRATLWEDNACISYVYICFTSADGSTQNTCIYAWRFLSSDTVLTATIDVLNYGASVLEPSQYENDLIQMLTDVEVISLQ